MAPPSRSSTPRHARPDFATLDGLAVFAVLIALLVLRAVVAVTPGNWLWGLQSLQWIEPAAAVTLWGLAALTLVPPIAARLAPAVSGFGRLIERTPWGAGAALGIATATVVALLPDRTWFVGDFLLRMAALDTGRDLAQISPQALPLDVLLHITLPRALASARWFARPEDAVRLLGAAEAGLLAILAVGLSSEFVRAGAARACFAAALLGGTVLLLFTGYAKGLAELVPLTFATIALARRLARDGRGAVALGVVLAATLAMHRSGLMLMPAWLAAWIVAWRARRVALSPARVAIGVGLPLVVFAVLAPRIIGLLLHYDMEHHVPGGSIEAGPWWSAFAPLSLLDRFNVALAYAPLVLAWPVLALSRLGVGSHPHESDAPRAVAWGVALPALLMALLVVPQQGIFRDWDDFALPGTVLAVFVAAAVARAALGALARVAAPVIACSMLAAFAGLLGAHDTERGLARVRAFLAEPPARGAVERGRLWEFLGDRAASLARWNDSAEALSMAVRTQPSPRLFSMLAIAEESRGHLEGAQHAWAMAAERYPSDTTAWKQLIQTSIRRSDMVEARRAARGLLQAAPDHPLARQVLGRP